MTHPYSIFIWQPDRHNGGRWIEPLQVYTQEYAIYVANLIHKDTKAVIKVIRFGIPFAFFPDKQTVDRVDRYVKRQKEFHQSQ